MAAISYTEPIGLSNLSSEFQLIREKAHYTISLAASPYSHAPLRYVRSE